MPSGHASSRCWDPERRASRVILTSANLIFKQTFLHERADESSRHNFVTPVRFAPFQSVPLAQRCKSTGLVRNPLARSSNQACCKRLKKWRKRVMERMQSVCYGPAETAIFRSASVRPRHLFGHYLRLRLLLLVALEERKCAGGWRRRLLLRLGGQGGEEGGGGVDLLARHQV